MLSFTQFHLAESERHTEHCKTRFDLSEMCSILMSIWGKQNIYAYVVSMLLDKGQLIEIQTQL